MDPFAPPRMAKRFSATAGKRERGEVKERVCA
jgi:hypothetical protein